MLKTKSKNIPAKQADSDKLFSNKEYELTLADLKKQIRFSQLKAALAASKELLQLYWIIGKTIVKKQEDSGWGSKFIEKLAKDLQNGFPGVEGFSRTNLFRMKAFYNQYKLVPPSVGQFNELLLISC